MFFLSEQRSIINRLNAGSKAVRSEYRRVDKLYSEYSKAVGWWGTFFALADGDITKLSQVLTTQLETVLFWLQLKNRKTELDQQVQKVISEETEKKMKQKK